MSKIDPYTIFSMISGISTPVAGVQWNLPIRTSEHAWKLISELENRRVLYAPWHHESIIYATLSIQQIRDRMTELLSEVGSRSLLAKPLKAMRTACRDFLSATQNIQEEVIQQAVYEQKWNNASAKYFMELGKLRSVFGYYIGEIAVKYHVDVEYDLTTIIPKYGRQS